MKKRVGLVIATTAAAAVMAGGTAYAASTSSASPVDSTGAITGCYTAPNKTGSSQLTLQTAGTSCPSGDSAISWNEQGQAGPQGPAGPQGSAGPTGLNGLNGLNGQNGANGANGANGSNGTNGSSVITSTGAPTGACTPGDTDIELTSGGATGEGEVWTCNNPGTSWTDTGSSIQGPQGTQGQEGAAGQQGPPGPQGAAGSTTPVELTWTFTCSSSCGYTSSATSIPAGTVLTPVTLSASGGCTDKINYVGIFDGSGAILEQYYWGGNDGTGYDVMQLPVTTPSTQPLQFFVSNECATPVTATFTFDETQSFS